MAPGSSMNALASMPFEGRARSVLPYVAWTQALVATVGSLFLSEVMRFVPCSLCWYQRILMYPLVAIIGVGIVFDDRRVHRYVLPLSVAGLAVAGFHNLLYYGLVPESAVQCAVGVSCTTRHIEWLGFVTIPLLSLIAFGVITLTMTLARGRSADA